MMIVPAKLSKKRLLLWALPPLLALAAWAVFHSPQHTDQTAARLHDNESRVAYLRAYGWDIDPEPVETLQLQLPDPLPASYQTYNDLQTQQGLDLSAACGKTVTRYTYTVTNYPGHAEGVQVNLYLCEELPVAGDVLCSGENGFQTGLAYPETADTPSAS